MTDRCFTTRTGLSATWPSPPGVWSYSSLSDVEGCPRRYALRHGTYEGLWDRTGYPDNVSEASLVGTAIHYGVELVLRSMCASQCPSVRNPAAVDVLRHLGGFSTVARDAVANALQPLATNPRMSTRLEHLKQRLERRVNEIRAAIQMFVSRATLGTPPAAENDQERGADRGARRPLRPGTYAEEALVAEAVRFTGRVDLLTVTQTDAAILDFKTGAPSEHHATQLEVYGLLWTLDATINPDRVPVGRLTIAYRGGDVNVPVPDDWSAVQSDLQSRVTRADGELEKEPPAAVPSEDCWHCAVRHMCEDYWSSPFLNPKVDSPVVDAQVEVLERNGPTSWRGRLKSGVPALIRTSEQAEALTSGQTVRMLNVLAGSDPEGIETILTMTRVSEAFTVDQEVSQ